MTDNAHLALLRSLDDCAPYLMPESTLFAEVNIRLARPITLSEFLKLVGEQEGKRRVVSVRDSDGNLKWKITDNGLARLAELR